jgi:hypothetical protein
MSKHKQTDIQALFSKVKTPQKTVTSEKISKPTNILRSSDAEVQQFYDQLTPQEQIAHTVAIEKLGTSYNVRRTHGFNKWLKSFQK